VTQPVGWGVIGTGAVAVDFARALATVPDARRVAVASRRPERAQRFAADHEFDGARDDVSTLLADPAVDVVYIASSTSLHHEHALAALAAGKAVICEKPFTASAGQAAEVVAAARAAGRFCMEGMWLRFNSVVVELKRQLDAGALGAVSTASISVGYAKSADTRGLPADGRGAMRTYGCYAFSLAVHLFGPVQSVSAVVRRDAAGVDTSAAVLLDHGSSTTTIDTSVSTQLGNRLEICAAQAVASIPRSVIDPQQLVVRRFPRNGRRQVLADAFAPLAARLPASKANARSGFRGEIAEAMHCVRGGLTESGVMPLDETLHVQRLMEEALSGRADIGDNPGAS